MATLPSEALDTVWANIMSDFSALRTLIPISKPQLRWLLGLMDSEIETAEISIIQALPTGEGRTWLIANPGIGREFMSRVLDKRQEVL